MRVRFFLFLFLNVFASMVSSKAYAEGKSVKICNHTGKKISVAVGWLDYGFPIASGWYIYNDDECHRIMVPKADSYLPVFAYAVDTDEKEYRPFTNEKNYFCVNRTNPFTEKSTTACKLLDEASKQTIADWEKFNALGSPFAEAYTWDVR